MTKMGEADCFSHFFNPLIISPFLFGAKGGMMVARKPTQK